MGKIDFTAGFIFGVIFSMLLIALTLAFSPKNSAEMCTALVDNDYNVAWVSETQECRMFDENGHLVPFVLVPVD